MKRILIILVALGLLVAFAAPAGAAKPDKPGKPATLVNVTLTGDLETQECPGALVMEEGRTGVLFAGQNGPEVSDRIRIHSVPKDWWRHFPSYALGDFEKCHGGPVSGSPMEWQGGLWITPTDNSVEILWHFDHYWDDGVPKPHGKKLGMIIENFTLRGEAIYDVVDGLYKGNFTISHFLRNDGIGEYETFEPIEVSLSFQVTTVPYSP